MNKRTLPAAGLVAAGLVAAGLAVMPGSAQAFGLNLTRTTILRAIDSDGMATSAIGANRITDPMTTGSITLHADRCLATDHPVAFHSLLD